jgi:uncharacterized protein (DUF1330 family)
MNPLTPDDATLERLLADARPGPITLLNLLRFRDDGGREAFQRYSAISGPLVVGAGGEPVIFGEAGTVLAGEGAWDTVIAIRFPDVLRFVEMIRSDVYQSQAVPLRAEALERTLWMAVQPSAG